MNKLIKEQLEKIEIADLSNFDDNTNTYYIKKHVDEPSLLMKVNTSYILKIDRALLKDGDAQLLSSNFNNNTYPPSEYFKAKVTNVVGTMIRVDGIAYDIKASTSLNEMWCGWLPKNGVKAIKEIGE